MTLLKHDINSLRRNYFIDKVNAPLLKAVTILGNRYPEPDVDNVLHPNSKRLVAIRDKYNQYEGNHRIKQIVMAVLRILISKVEHSPNYRDRFSWFVEELKNGEWKPRSYNHPQRDWKEPRPYGGQR